MSKFLGYLILFFLVLSLVGISCSSSIPTSTATKAAPASPPPAQSGTKPIELNFNSVLAQNHIKNTTIVVPWIEEIQKRSGGKVKITMYYNEALAQRSSLMDAVKSGICDITEGSTNYSPGLTPLGDVMELPGTWDINAIPDSRAVWKAFNTIPELQAEFSSVKVLSLHSGPPIYFYNAKRPINSIEDYKGLKLQYPGAMGQKVASKFGFTQLSTPTGEVYVGLQNGVLDGGVSALESIDGSKFYEIAKYGTRYDLGHRTFYVIMNKEKYNSLPSDVKKVFDDLTGEPLMERFASNIVDNEVTMEQKLKGAGFKFNDLASAEKAKWDELLKPIADQWVTELEAKGKPAKKLLDLMKSTIAEKK